MDKKVLKWNFIFQYGWVITNIINSILLLPLYLHHIDATTLGVWLATGNILGWMILVDPGIGEVLQQNIAEMLGRKEHDEIGRTIGSGFIASALILIISVVLGFIFYFSIGFIINKDVSQYPHLATALVITIISTGMSLVSFSMSGINQGLHNSAHVAIAGLSANFLFLIVNLVFLFLGFGVMSIAAANLCRAVYINIYNIKSMFTMLRKKGLALKIDFSHFKVFIRIFSFTSASKIVSGLSGSIDMIVLARFIPPSLITIFEINRRPINLVYSLIGRHSVALMPVISHAKGSGDKQAILNFIKKQFRFYAYATLFTAFLFCLVYKNLITAWTGKGQFAGYTILYLLVANFFFALIGYFMSNMGYALGDIKRNSLINIIRGLCLGVLIYFAAGRFGIVGAISASLTISIFADFFYFTYRLYKIGYLETSLIKNALSHWAVVIPFSAAAVWSFNWLVESLMPADMYFSKLVITSGLFVLFFITLLLVTDADIRDMLKQLKGNLFFWPLKKKLRTGPVQ